jgi:MFS family permease
MESTVEPQHTPTPKRGPVSLEESYFPVALVTVLVWNRSNPVSESSSFYGDLHMACLMSSTRFTQSLIHRPLSKDQHFQNTLHVSKVQSSGLQAAYFGAYFVSPIAFSVYVLRRWGYKYTFMLGLSIYGVGAVLFWPCAYYRSFAGFCVCTFVIGLGLGTLEVSANPYFPSLIFVWLMMQVYCFLWTDGIF